MIFTELILKGAYLIEPERTEDDRGFFARVFCGSEFAEYGLNCNIEQCSVSFNRKAGTLRGMHYQAAPFGEAKLVRCTSGGIFDVVVDLREDSPTFLQWSAVTLDSARRNMLYVPAGFAHGFQTLEDNTEVLYHMSETYHPESARAIRWDDPAVAIRWPFPRPILSDKDRCVPDFRPELLEALAI